MLDPNLVPVSQSALLVIDAQDSFKAGPRWERRNNHDFEKNVAALIDAYREAKLPVVFFLHTDEDDAFRAGNPFFKLMDFITPRAEREGETQAPRQALALGRNPSGDDLREQQIVDAKDDLEGCKGEEAEDDRGIGQKVHIVRHGSGRPWSAGSGSAEMAACRGDFKRVRFGRAD